LIKKIVRQHIVQPAFSSAVISVLLAMHSSILAVLFLVAFSSAVVVPNNTVTGVQVLPKQAVGGTGVLQASIRKVEVPRIKDPLANKRSKRQISSPLFNPALGSIYLVDCEDLHVLYLIGLSIDFV